MNLGFILLLTRRSVRSSSDLGCSPDSVSPKPQTLMIRLAGNWNQMNDIHTPINDTFSFRVFSIQSQSFQCETSKNVGTS